MDMELDIMVMDTDTMERDKPYTLRFRYQEMTLDSGDKFSKPAG